MREVISTMSAQFSISPVIDPKNSGKLYDSNGLKGIFLVVFGNFPRRKFMARARAIVNPTIYPIITPATPMLNNARVMAITRLVTMYMMVIVAIFPKR